MAAKSGKSDILGAHKQAGGLCEPFLRNNCQRRSPRSILSARKRLLQRPSELQSQCKCNFNLYVAKLPLTHLRSAIVVNILYATSVLRIMIRCGTVKPFFKALKFLKK